MQEKNWAIWRHVRWQPLQAEHQLQCEKKIGSGKAISDLLEFIEN